MADLVLSVDVTSLADAKRKLDGFQKAMNGLTVNRLAAGVDSLQNNIKQLVNAQARGVISTGAYEKGLLQIKRAYEQLGYSSQKATSEVRRFAAQIEQQRASQVSLASAAHTSSRGMNAMGVGMQQAGYQVGDFLVQVQSGTNAMVAFGQQATQLVGILPMFNSVMGISGTKLIGLSAGLGIAIPLLTAIGAAFMRTRQTAASATGGFTTMEAAMKSAREESGRMADEIERLNLGLRSNTELNLTRAIAEQTKRVSDAQALAEQVAGTDGGFVAEQRLAREQETLREYQQQLQTLKDQAQEIDDIKEAREQEVENAREQIELQEQYRESLRRTQRQQLEALLEAGRIAEEGRQTREDIAHSLEREAELYREIARFGEDSAQVEALRAQQARDAHLARIQETTTNEVLIRQAMERYDAMVQTREEADRVTSALKQVESANLSSFNDQVRMLATLLGTSADEAARLLSNMPVGMTFGNRGALSSYTGEELLPPARRQPRGGDKGPNAIERLQQEIAFRQRTLNLSKEEKALQTEIFRITNALGENRNKYSSDFIANLAQQNLAIQEQERVIEEARQQQEQLADSIANSFGDAFMSIVDGTKSTKDAFKQMAAAIVRDLYQVYVMKRLIGSAEAGTGIAGAIGRLIGLESGGTMTANRPYLVGERGPELVIPGRSATVTNADLTRKSMGGSDGVVVNQTINVNGGTDPAAIRMEVAKLMPTITNATKTAVIDARRRGGQMKAAFQ